MKKVYEITTVTTKYSPDRVHPDGKQHEDVFLNYDEAMIYAMHLLKKYCDIGIFVSVKSKIVWQSAEHAIEDLEEE
ncbi:MAG: hypothetical protein KGJ07_00175 [Patescibacteria group bacterium]|nr:hypothetical protein [Patescibacteria group bacterium]